MKTLRRYMVREIMLATAMVMMALLMLFAFFDFVNEIKDLGRGSYQLRHIVRQVALSLPGHVYEIFPIAALIGTLFALSQLVASSEYTVMRTSGVSVTRIVGVILSAGVVVAALTFVFGEYVAPAADQWAQRLRSRAITGIVAQEFRSGVWLKDDKSFINVREVTDSGQLKGVRIYDFDDGSRLRMGYLPLLFSWVRRRYFSMDHFCSPHERFSLSFSSLPHHLHLRRTFFLRLREVNWAGRRGVLHW